MASTRNGRYRRGPARGYGRYGGYDMKGAYVDGNTARQVQTLPQEKYPKEQPAVSRATRKNRERAQDMTRVFVLFLAVVSVAVLCTCVKFLRLKSQITNSIQTIASLESEYSQLKADNDAYESQLNASVDLEQVKKTAMDQLGMKYPTDNQVITYQVPKGSYVRQYQDVPNAK